MEKCNCCGSVLALGVALDADGKPSEITMFCSNCVVVPDRLESGNHWLNRRIDKTYEIQDISV
jgi:hypothetical protein